MCKPNEKEFIKRAKKVCDRIADGVYEHVDLALYQLHLHATRDHLKGVMKKKDVPSLVGRLEIMWPSKKKDEIPKVDVAYLPEDIKAFINGKTVFQVVWMYNGQYHQLASGIFKSRFSISRFGERVYKNVETLGFSEIEACHKMWLESLHHVGTGVFYEGRGFRQDIGEPVFMRARMLSHVVDYSHLITAMVVEDLK